jgi:hypothetical protein
LPRVELWSSGRDVIIPVRLSRDSRIACAGVDFAVGFRRGHGHGVQSRHIIVRRGLGFPVAAACVAPRAFHAARLLARVRDFLFPQPRRTRRAIVGAFVAGWQDQ